MDLPEYPWYALYIRPRFEKAAAKYLRDEGYAGYVPLLLSKGSRCGKIKGIELPLLPGYIFCRFDFKHRLPVLLAPGVLSVVGIGKNPAPILESEISFLRRVIASGAKCGPWPFVEGGQRFCVERGPLAGLDGTIVHVESEMRLILSLPALRRSIAVEIDPDCVEVDSGAEPVAGNEVQNGTTAAIKVEDTLRDDNYEQRSADHRLQDDIRQDRC